MSADDPMNLSPREPCVLHLSLAMQAQQWASGLECLCAVLEAELLPAERLVYGLENRKIVRLKDRQAYLERMAGTKYRDVLIQNSPDRAASLTVRGVLTDGARLTFDLMVIAPALAWDERARLLQVCGDAAGVYTGGFSPAFSASALYAYANLTRPGASHVTAAPVSAALEAANETLPGLHPVAIGGARSSPVQPDQLYWVNYWSAAACKLLGFPDVERDQEWLRLARQTAAGAWMVRLTDEPFDVRSPAHIGVLARGYRRFAAIGVRSEN